MKLGNSGKCPDDVPDDICHPPAKSHPKSHSRVICTSSARHLHEISTGNIFPLKEQTALLKMKEIGPRRGGGEGGGLRRVPKFIYVYPLLNYMHFSHFIRGLYMYW